MTIGVAVFLLALGAILRYAITFSIAGVSLATVGLILMIAGGLGLVAALIVSRRGEPPDRAASADGRPWTDPELSPYRRDRERL